MHGKRNVLLSRVASLIHPRTRFSLAGMLVLQGAGKVGLSARHARGGNAIDRSSRKDHESNNLIVAMGERRPRCLTRELE